MRASTTSRRPGVRFDAPTPTRADDLPRMEVAALVGFAASGPLHVAVAVESIVEFEEVFGRDLALGLDAEGNEPLVAQLPPSVRAFFTNGGRRCHVVRVAREAGEHRAVANRFPLQGLVPVEVDGSLGLATVTADARSEGSWSDNVIVTAALEVEALRSSVSADFVTARPWLSLATPQRLAPGELVRVTTVNGVHGWCFVEAVRAVEGTSARTEWQRGPELWWTRTPALEDSTAPTFSEAAWREGAVTSAVVLRPHDPSVPFVSRDGEALVTTDDARAATLRPGALIELRGGSARWWLFVDDLSPVAWRLAGTTVDRAHAPLVFSAASDSRWEARWRDPAAPDRDVSVRITDRAEGSADGTAWTTTDPRITSVPVGAVLFLYETPLGGEPTFRGYVRVRTLAASRWSLRGAVRELTAAPGTTDAARWRVERVSLSLRSAHDGREATVGALGFSDAHPRPWTHLPTDHTLFSPWPSWRENPDAALWADARRPRLAVAAPASPSSRALPLGLAFARPVSRRAWTSPDLALVREGLTLPAGGARAIDSTVFTDARLANALADTVLDAADRLRDEALHHGAPPVRGLHAALGLAEVTLLASPDVLFTARTLRAPPVPAPVEVPFPPVPPAPPPDVGAFELCEEPPEPPPVALVLPRTPARVTAWRFDPSVVRDDAPATLAAEAVRLQRQAVRLCAVRGDMTVALSAPPQLRAQGVARHVAAVQRTDGALDGIDLAGERWVRALSFATLHHPWLMTRDGAPDAPVRAQAPDGAVLGLIARRTIARGAWIAPAWEPLRDVLALAPALADAEVNTLLDARVNAVSREPRGVLPLDARTLSDDPDYEHLSVRRLMILLRRAALERGERYVFEPLGGALRRSVQLGFESLLGVLFDRGAFAGATREEAFRVTVLDGSGDDAKLVIELRVAPSVPLRFLTVRLVQRGDAFAAAGERGG